MCVGCCKQFMCTAHCTVSEHIGVMLHAQGACKLRCIGDGATCRVRVGALGVAWHTAFAQLLSLALGSHTVPVPYLLSPCPIPCPSVLSPVPCPCTLSPDPGVLSLMNS